MTQDTKNYLNMDLLRFSTAGSVDDGKSTLIGRLFHDTKAIFEDQLEAIEKTSKQRGDENLGRKMARGVDDKGTRKPSCVSIPGIYP